MNSSLPFAESVIDKLTLLTSNLQINPSTTPWGLPGWVMLVPLIFAALFGLDSASKVYRDYKLRPLGSPPPVVPYLMPLGLDVGIYATYRLLKHTFFELLVSWMESVPGRTIELRIGGQGLTITDEPDNLKAIMSSKYSSFGRGDVTRKVWGNMIGDDQIFITDGEVWHQSKELIRPHVEKQRHDDLEISEKHLQELFKCLPEHRPVEVFDLIDREQLDTVTEVFFGESASSLTSEPPFRDPMEKLNTINTARMLFGKFALYAPDYLLAPKALKDLNAYTTAVIDRAYARDLSKKKPEDYTMMDDLVSQKKNYKKIKEAIMSIMLGGKDPSSILITWAIYEMGKNPHVMKKMQAEVARVCGTRIPTASELRDLTYVRHVINENFRLHHPLGVNVRTSLENVTLPTGGGKSGKEPLAVSKGTTIIYSLMAMQRRKDLYGPDADIFRPERWEGANVKRWNFIPYNHGPRSCIGRNFGQMQMEYILARICQEFEEIRVPDGQRQQQVKIELNVKMAHPCMCEFVRKEKTEGKT